jgi:uncharacterized membrane protein (DUF106 family)
VSRAITANPSFSKCNCITKTSGTITTYTDRKRKRKATRKMQQLEQKYAEARQEMGDSRMEKINNMRPQNKEYFASFSQVR